MLTTPMLLLSSLVGCESDAEIAADMERSLRDANAGLVPALVMAEVFHQIDVPPDRTSRHGTESCGCPCSDKIGVSLPYVLTLDYNVNGCVPDSGLVPTALTGHVVLDFDGADCNATWDGLLVALEHEVGGEITGNVGVSAVTSSSGIEPGVFDPRGALTIGPWSGDLDLHIEIGADAVYLDGSVTADDPEDPRAMQYDGVRLPLASIAGRCPTPDQGLATLVNPDKEQRSAVVRFAEPGNGEVTVQRDDRISEATDWCAYASELW